VFRKELSSYSIPFSVYLPYASYFTGGIALHEYADVPSYPASHGCVRVPSPEAKMVYRFASLGTPVVVY
jgi:lipoprotein-anchoring transpeptidase ErfK/SrfK